MQPADSRLTILAQGAVEPMGYELVGVELFQRGAASSTLRVYIDHPDGITLDDCEAVSHQLSGVLDVEDPISGHYDLEISSPGLDRPLVFPEHFERFVGHRIRVRLAEKIEGRRKLDGVLIGADPEQIRLRESESEREWQVPLVSVESARLVPEF